MSNHHNQDQRSRACAGHSHGVSGDPGIGQVTIGPYHGHRASWVRRGLFVAASIACAVLVAGCGGGGSPASSSAAASEAPGAPAGFFANGTLTPRKPAPPLALTDSLGHPVDLRSFRGRAVLVTFIYTHCPDVCPLIVGNLKTAQAQLGAQASKLQIVAVSTDPRGDTPAAVAKFLGQRGMTGRMEYLVGDGPALAPVWKAWHIEARPDQQTPAFVEHSALVYGISASGQLVTIYPSNLRPDDVSHDVPELAAL